MRLHKQDVFPGYMTQAIGFFKDQPAGQHILDLPAGNGKLTAALRDLGHTVTPADINLQKSDFVYADMTKRLPFDDETFDGAICLEGIEHVLNPFLLLGELIRVSKVGGHVVVSTPNIMNMWSRLQFLFTGTFYQFHPAQLHDYEPEEAVDRFHISPMSYHTMRYLGEYFGADVAEVRGDKAKRGFLAPLYMGIQVAGSFWSRSLYFSKKYEQYRERNARIHQQSNSWPAMTGRSIVMVFEKKRSTRVVPTDVFLSEDAVKAA
ncbi:class I SAM-dependent methyltransferase [Rubinisphaera margarita]|uniref:class I SAM-dependent methyltransferase n=1 Tax=Rubinisphaera margarita TaxID=2909586 RepID=UPI001EE8AD43|nr:class I SAM-dependent methyltransferase [Rubinisphaera margarita]MCG6157943.1 class I SAM-dependent methyltransferase [Rubinisphaera margarita]